MIVRSSSKSLLSATPFRACVSSWQPDSICFGSMRASSNLGEPASARRADGGYKWNADIRRFSIIQAESKESPKRKSIQKAEQDLGRVNQTRSISERR